MSKRTLSDWTSYADKHAWSIVGNSLYRRTVAVLGQDKAVDVQFGNIIGWLRDRGEYELATDIRQAIAEYNGNPGPLDI